MSFHSSLYYNNILLLVFLSIIFYILSKALLLFNLAIILYLLSFSFGSKPQIFLYEQYSHGVFVCAPTSYVGLIEIFPVSISFEIFLSKTPV